MGLLTPRSHLQSKELSVQHVAILIIFRSGCGKDAIRNKTINSLRQSHKYALWHLPPTHFKWGFIVTHWWRLVHNCRQMPMTDSIVCTDTQNCCNCNWSDTSHCKNQTKWNQHCSSEIFISWNTETYNALFSIGMNSPHHILLLCLQYCPQWFNVRFNCPQWFNNDSKTWRRFKRSKNRTCAVKTIHSSLNCLYFS